LAAGDRRAAEADFRAGIQEIENERAGFNEPPLRIAHFERASPLFEHLVQLLIDENRTSEALSVADRKRGREVLDRLAHGNAIKPTEPLDTNRLAGSVAPTQAILEFAILDHGTATWLVQRDQIYFHRSTTLRAEIDQTIDRQIQEILKNDVAAAKRDGRWLVERLIGPLEPHLRDATVIEIVPEGSLYRVPFASLVEADGSYWIEHRAIAISTSSAALLQSRGSAAGRG